MPIENFMSMIVLMICDWMTLSTLCKCCTEWAQWTDLTPGCTKRCKLLKNIKNVLSIHNYTNYMHWVVNITISVPDDPFWHQSSLSSKSTLMGGTGSQIMEYAVRSNLECAALCAAALICSDINVIRSSAAGKTRCQLVINGGTGPTGNTDTNSLAYKIHIRK